jgi:hypothetical protein
VVEALFRHPVAFGAITICVGLGGMLISDLYRTWKFLSCGASTVSSATVEQKIVPRYSKIVQHITYYFPADNGYGHGEEIRRIPCRSEDLVATEVQMDRDNEAIAKRFEGDPVAFLHGNPGVNYLGVPPNLRDFLWDLGCLAALVLIVFGIVTFIRWREAKPIQMTALTTFSEGQ